MKDGAHGQHIPSDLFLSHFLRVMVNQPCLQHAAPDRKTLGDKRALTLCKVCRRAEGGRGEHRLCHGLPRCRRSSWETPYDPHAHRNTG